MRFAARTGFADATSDLTTGASTTGAAGDSTTDDLATGAAGATGDSTTGVATGAVCVARTSAIVAGRESSAAGAATGDSTTGFSTTGFSTTIVLEQEATATGRASGTSTTTDPGDDMFCAMLSIARRIEPISGLSPDIDDKKRPSASGEGGLNVNGASPLASATRRESASEKIASNCIAPTVISPASLQ